MRSRRRLLALCATVLAITISACSSGHGTSDPVEATGKKLASETLHAPMGYVPDGTAGATGTMSDPVFAREGGVGSAQRAGFRGGFREIYDSQSSNETIEITLLRFESPTRARAYMDETTGRTLAIYAPTRRSYSAVPGAVELTGTKAYQGIWARGVVATRGNDYMFLVYLLNAKAAPPLEYGLWVKDQYAALT